MLIQEKGKITGKISIGRVAEGEMDSKAHGEVDFVDDLTNI